MIAISSLRYVNPPFWTRSFFPHPPLRQVKKVEANLDGRWRQKIQVRSLRTDFQNLSLNQQELICCTNLFLAHHSIESKLGKRLSNKIAVPLIGCQLSRVDDELNVIDLFQSGIYGKEPLASHDSALNLHLDSGGGKSPF